MNEKRSRHGNVRACIYWTPTKLAKVSLLTDSGILARQAHNPRDLYEITCVVRVEIMVGCVGCHRG